MRTTLITFCFIWYKAKTRQFIAYIYLAYIVYDKGFKARSMMVYSMIYTKKNYEAQIELNIFLYKNINICNISTIFAQDWGRCISVKCCFDFLFNSSFRKDIFHYMPVFSTTKSTNLVSALQLISHRRQNKSYLRIQQHNIDKERKGCQNVVHQNKMHVGCGGLMI